jgi:hypothetical protein
MAANAIAGYTEGLLGGKESAYALDRNSRKAALARFPREAAGEEEALNVEHERLAA